MDSGLAVPGVDSGLAVPGVDSGLAVPVGDGMRAWEEGMRIPPPPFLVLPFSRSFSHPSLDFPPTPRGRFASAAIRDRVLVSRRATMRIDTPPSLHRPRPRLGRVVRPGFHMPAHGPHGRLAAGVADPTRITRNAKSGRPTGPGRPVGSGIWLTRFSFLKNIIIVVNQYLYFK